MKQSHSTRLCRVIHVICLVVLLAVGSFAEETSTHRVYKNQLTRIADPRPLLADYRARTKTGSPGVQKS